MAVRPRARKFRGTPVAEGIAIGPVAIVDAAHLPRHVPRYSLAEGDLAREIQRFRDARDKARSELEKLARRVEARIGRREAELIEAQALMLGDPAFVAGIEEQILERRVNAEAAVADVMERFEKLIAGVEDSYLRERTSDVRDAGQRILARLLFVEDLSFRRLTQPSIIVSQHLTPSLTVHLDRDLVLAFATEKGGYTSHAAILARSLGIPAVTGLEGITDEVMDGETAVVDGGRGVVIVRPDREDRARFARARGRLAAGREELMAHAAEPAMTRDGVAVSVLANVGRPDEAAAAFEHGAAGIGLYRTEFDFFDHAKVPSEEILARHYAEVADVAGDRGVAFRILDIGGDKFPASLPLAHEENPFLGVRGLRLMLRHVDDLMLPQLRAILRASARGRVSVVYPMVSGVDDLEAAREVFRRARREARPAGKVAEGTMIEVPSCIPMLPEILRRCDFATVGTNDLVAYLLAADRNSERMVDAYDPCDPAVARTLATIRQAAEAEGKPVSICGEIAGDSAMIPLLLGLGFRSLSVNVGAVPSVKQTIRRLSAAECADLARDALKAPTAAELRRLARDFRPG